jgi:hypothetical protein
MATPSTILALLQLLQTWVGLSPLRMEMVLLVLFQGNSTPIRLRSPDSRYARFFRDIRCLTAEQAVDQTLGVATEYSSSFVVDQFPPDGLMGLAFQSVSIYNATPVFESIVSEGQTDEPVFSFKLATSGSELYLGGANSTLYTGDFAYTPVTQQVSCGSGVFSTVSDIDQSGLLASHLG